MNKIYCLKDTLETRWEVLFHIALLNNQFILGWFKDFNDCHALQTLNDFPHYLKFISELEIKEVGETIEMRCFHFSGEIYQIKNTYPIEKLLTLDNYEIRELLKKLI